MSESPHLHLGDIRNDINEIRLHPETPYPYVILHTPEHGRIRFTFFTYDEQSQAVFAAIGPTDETKPEFQTRLQEAKQQGKWISAVIQTVDTNYSIRLTESEIKEFPDLYASLEAQGAFSSVK